MSHTSILRHIFHHLVLFHVIPDVVHLSRFCPRKVVIDSMSLQMSSFLTWSFLVLPLAHLSILISVVCSFCVSFFLNAQHSDPYIIAGMTMVLEILSLSVIYTFIRRVYCPFGRRHGTVRLPNYDDVLPISPSLQSSLSLSSNRTLRELKYRCHRVLLSSLCPYLLP